MQGKERNNHQIDTEFQDFAWSEMSALLNKEMPVAPAPAASPAPHRRYALFAALLLLGFLSGVGTMLLLDKEVPSVPELQPAEKKIPQKIAELNDPKMDLSSAETDQLLVQQQTSQQVEARIQQTILNKTPKATNEEKLYINSSSVISDAQVASKSVSPSIHKENVPVSNAPIVVEAEAAAFDDAPVRSAIDFQWANALADLSAKPINELEYTRPAIDLAYIPIATAPKWSFGVGYSNHTRNWSGAHGWSAGLTADYRLDGAFSLRTGLSYSQLTGFRSTSFGINEPLTHTYFEPLDGAGDLNYSTVSSLEGNQDLPFQGLQYLDVPIALNYQMSKRVGVLMGVKLSYLLNTQMDGFVSEGLDENGKELLDQALYESMRKVDVATVLGLSIHPTRNIALEVKYNHGLIDYTKDQLWHIRQLNTNKTFELGLHYTLR